MSSNVSSEQSTEARLARATEDFLDRLDGGERPDVEEYVRDYPDVASVLRQVLPALQALRDTGAADDQEPARALGQLGDFRLVREVGRGGMGIVYEAEQLSLNRRVALKVLPFAATLDPRQLQRFHNEARAAAHLHHPNIVPVHGVGTERGVHYYAMQFIDGRTLAGVLDAQRRPAAPSAAAEPSIPADPPTQDDTRPAASVTGQAPCERTPFRQVALWGVEAAEALEHAHRLGIVHRDVKPANLMLDGQGKLWVTDFGLARTTVDGGLTMTGDVVGTLRYMSPEQAMARHGLVDHRTDVYALGATLYELLTLRPVAPGVDRQEILRQITCEEPVPPRHLNRTIPADLETIVLKALSKEPAERYATAGDLADDLRRFAADEPVRARRPTWRQRGYRWARRHQSAVWSVALALLVGVAVLAGLAGWALSAREARRKEVEAALGEAGRLLAEGNPWAPELIAAASRAEALAAGGLLGESWQRRVQAVLADLKMLEEMEQVRLDQAALKGSEFDLMSADEGYARAFAEYGIDVETLAVEEAAARIRGRAIAVHLAAALDSWALARRKKTGSDWKRLLAVARAADPERWRTEVRQALLSEDRKALVDLAGRIPIEALPAPTVGFLGAALGPDPGGPWELAAALTERAQRRHPADFWINHDLGDLLGTLQPPRWEEAIGFLRAAVAIHPRSAGAVNKLGCALVQQGKREAAEEAFRAAIRLRPTYADAHYNLGNMLHARKNHNEAVAAYREAIRLRPNYAKAHNNLGNALADLGKRAEAEAAYRKALALRRDYPEGYFNLGICLSERGKLVEAESAYRKFLRLRPASAAGHFRLGLVLRKQQKHAEALAAYQEAVRLQDNYPRAHYNLGNTLTDLGKRVEALAAYRKALHHRPDYPEAHYNLGNTLYALGKMVEADAAYRQAIRLRPGVPESHYNLGATLISRGLFAQALEALRRGHELSEGKPHLLALGDRQIRECKRLLVLDRKLASQQRPTNPEEAAELAVLCLDYKRLPATAVRLFEEAFADRSQWVVHRQAAARAAALAGCGQGDDAGKLDAQEKARLRRQALTWLRDELAELRQRLEKGTPAARAAARAALKRWQQDPDLAGVRPDPPQALPEAEARVWGQLWSEVTDALRTPAARP